MSHGIPDFIFVCRGPTCGERGGREIFQAWKERLVATDRWDDCRVVSVECMGMCCTGPNVCVVPTAEFLSGVDPGEATKLLEGILGSLETPAT